MFSALPATNIDAAEAVPSTIGPKALDCVELPSTTSRSEDTSSLLYQLMVLEKALNNFYNTTQHGSVHKTNIQGESLISDQQWFSFFMNKLAQACDSERGGKTVSAITILQGLDGPVFLLASNQRDDDELDKAKSFVEKLLRLVGDNPDRLKKKPRVKQVLNQILEFGIKRVDLYLKYLEIHLDECIACCSMNADAEIKDELEKLKVVTVFPRDIVSTTNARLKFFSDCSTLINAILAMKNTTFEKYITKRAIGDNVSNPEPWRELRHYCGRLFSYRQAAETLLAAQERWPPLFKSFTVFPISSGTRMPKPIRTIPSHPITAAQIIKNMGLDTEQMEFYLLQIQPLERMGLDKGLQSIVANPRFRPIIHAEVLIHDCLQRLPVDPEHLYWNNWKYIGSSKPTCRLCSYYFEGRDVTVRESHNNLYPSWRLPDLPEHANETAVDMHLSLLARLKDHMRNDIERLIHEKKRAGKRHDSLTYSGAIEDVDDLTSVTCSVSGTPSTLISELENCQVGTTCGTPSQSNNDDWVIAGEKSDISGEDENDSSDGA
ncbi:hypothetical protein JX265_004630 [Neoarthrinium moseri]|uniref:Uncharacterized protein n=1 Tax=Neoarthrinium moseri TaxID=1658444 RepID=A0A9Q0AQN9_9PEZI|nr:hypothetical protein JX265_004630 [Neoarthrinium moseri]